METRISVYPASAMFSTIFGSVDIICLHSAYTGEQGRWVKVNFTADRIATFKCELSKKQSLYWDAKTPGLGLRVTANGVKSFIFESRLHGKTLRITIGDIRTWQIGKAQSQATELKSLTDRGIDPRQQRTDLRHQAEAAQAEEQRRVLTLGDAWPVYLEARKEHWSAGHYGDHMQAASLGGMSKKRGSSPGNVGPSLGRCGFSMAQPDDSRQDREQRRRERNPYYPSDAVPC